MSITNLNLGQDTRATLSGCHISSAHTFGSSLHHGTYILHCGDNLQYLCLVHACLGAASSSSWPVACCRCIPKCGGHADNGTRNVPAREGARGLRQSDSLHGMRVETAPMSDERWPICVKGCDVHRRRRRRESRRQIRTPGGRRDRHSHGGRSTRQSPRGAVKTMSK